MLRQFADYPLTVLRALLVLWISVGVAGCAALTNPVADGIAVCDLGPELLAPSKQGEEPIPMSLLALQPPAEYLLDGGDVLGVWIEGILDDKNQIPQARILEKTRRVPERGELPSSIGYPIPVRANGTVSLPLIKPIAVSGLTVEQAEAAIRQAYVAEKMLPPGRNRTFVTLQHKRLYQVVVFRHDLEVQGGLNTSLMVTNVGGNETGTFLLGKGSTGAGNQIDLPAYENDLVHALALTGGFPGTNAAREVVIFRKTTLTVRGQRPDADDMQPPWDAVLTLPRVVASDKPGDAQPSGGAAFGMPRELFQDTAPARKLPTGVEFGTPREAVSGKTADAEDMRPRDGAAFGTPHDADSGKSDVEDMQPGGGAAFGLPRAAEGRGGEPEPKRPAGAEFGIPREATLPTPKMGPAMSLPALKPPALPPMILPPGHFGEPALEQPTDSDSIARDRNDRMPVGQPVPKTPPPETPDPVLKVEPVPVPVPALKLPTPKGAAPVPQVEIVPAAGPGPEMPVPKASDPEWKKGPPQALPPPRGTLQRDVIIRIPLRAKRGQPLTINPSDIQLQSGDVVFVEAAPVEKFYTGGLLPSGEYVLPRDYDLDVLEAVTRVRGPLINGAFGGSNLSGTLIRPGIGGPSPRQLSVVRQTPDGGQVTVNVDLFCALRNPRERLLIKSGDVLILQESRQQAVARYFTEQFSVLSSFRILNHRDATSAATVVLP